MKIRKLIRIVHRDLGYISFGLTLVYAISGIAVNHVDDWNPNYIIENTLHQIPALRDSAFSNSNAVSHVLTQLNITDKPKNSFRASPDSIDIFFEGKTISANVKTGNVRIETVKSRTVFRETNFLHLNAPKKIWTYVADAFAISLAILAFTGLFMIKGRKGLSGRGKWFTAAGILIPIIFLIIYF